LILQTWGTCKNFKNYKNSRNYKKILMPPKLQIRFHLIYPYQVRSENSLGRGLKWPKQFYNLIKHWFWLHILWPFSHSHRQHKTEHVAQNSLPIHKKKLRKSEEKIVGENEVLFDLFYCPSVRCGGMGMDWVVWAVGYLVGWLVCGQLPTGSISYICCVGYFGPLAAATKLFCETANCRTYFLFMPLSLPHATWQCSRSVPASIPSIWYIPSISAWHGQSAQ